VYRHLVVAAALVGLFASCTIQPTPQEYIDRQIPADAERRQAEQALYDRIQALVQALQAGDVETAQATLSPAADVTVIGPGEGDRFTGEAQITAILDLVADADAGTIELADLQVGVTRRATAGWFAAWLRLHRSGVSEPVPLRVTGVYVVREAVWELQQAHFSLPAGAVIAAPAAAPEPSPAADG
jgi:hypothetical protein